MPDRKQRPEREAVRLLQDRILADLQQLGGRYRLPLSPALMDGLAADLGGFLADGHLAGVAFAFFVPTSDTINDGCPVLFDVWYDIVYGQKPAREEGQPAGLPLLELPGTHQFDIFLRLTEQFYAAGEDVRADTLHFSALHIRPAGLRLLRPPGGWRVQDVTYRAGSLAAWRWIYVAPSVKAMKG